MPLPFVTIWNDESPAHPTSAQPVYRLLPSHRQLHHCPFQLSDPREYASTLQELSRQGYSNPSGFIAERISNFTFLLRIIPVRREWAVQLIAVFEGDALSSCS